MPVVTVEPSGELIGAMSGSMKRGGISPPAQGRLDEALGLAIGPGGVGTGANVLDAQLTTGPTKGQSVEAGTVVGHDPLQTHAEALVVGNGLLKEGNGAGRCSLGRMAA